MLIDDNPDAAEMVIIKKDALEALDYLKSKKAGSEAPPPPDLIFLDINMPKMNGWEFLEEYKKLAKEFQSPIVIVMLTNSDNPDDMTRAKSFNEMCEFKTKPLTKEMLEEILQNYFQYVTPLHTPVIDPGTASGL